MTTLTTLRSFRHGRDFYRHAINLADDGVRLQRLNQHAETPAEEWETLLAFDAMCNAWDVSTSKAMGHFASRDVDGESRWVFTDSDTGERVVGERTSAAEGLLDFEVVISKRWLTVKSNVPVAAVVGMTEPAHPPVQGSRP